MDATTDATRMCAYRDGEFLTVDLDGDGVRLVKLLLPPGGAIEVDWVCRAMAAMLLQLRPVAPIT